jgi:16S rRNA G966 N2-methylase RsmD
MAEVAEFHINKEYQDLIPPLTPQEYASLKVNIDNEGQKMPIIVSNRTGQLVIVEGHHRYKIAKELGREPRYEIRHFESESQELEFIRDCNIEGRKSLTEIQKGVIILKTKDKLTEIAKKNSQANLKQNQDQLPPSVKCLTLDMGKGIGRVNDKLGKQAGMSHETLRKIEKIMKEAPQNIIDKAIKGQYSVNKAFKHLQNEQRRQELLSAQPVIKLPENTNYRLLQGDLIEKGKEIPDNSIDLILTDPPYNEASLPLYKDLGELAARVLKPGGSLVSIIGHYALIRSAKLIEESGLKYIHIMAIIHSGGSSMLYPYHTRVKWKPMLWYVKGTVPNTTTIIEDVIDSKPPDKSLHKWAQSPIEAERVIEGLTVGENQIVLDPFMGAGTFGIAALKLKRKFIGIEIDPDSFKIAEANIATSFRES